MKCPECNGVPYDEVWTCEECNGKGVVEPLTNEEYIKSCNTEQLAEFIIGERKGCVYADCPNGETPCMSCKNGCDIDKLVEWLKQPHRE